MKNLSFLAVFLISFTFFTSTAFAQKEYAVLLHGLARTKKAMSKMEKELLKEGFIVKNVDYPSTSKKIEDLSTEVLEPVINNINKKNPKKIHFVTHSMGGILIRAYLSQKKIDNLGNIVMLSPPNQGSEVVDTFGELSLFRWIYGPSGTQLGTKNKEFFKKIELDSVPVGVITGNRTINPILSLIIPGNDDGKVSIKNAKLKGMKDFIVINATHTFIAKNKTAIKETINFLKHQRFSSSSNKKSGLR